MGEHRYSQKILPKFQDLDTDVKYIKQGGVRYMKNLRLGNSSNGNLEIVENIRSTLEIPFDTLPNGINECIGTAVDIKKNRVLFANWNSNLYHCIYAYIVDENIIVEVYKDSPDNCILDFQRDYKMFGTRMQVLDGKFLFMTDRYNAQRFIDIDKGIEYNKKRIWHIPKDRANGDIEITVGGVLHQFDINNNIPQELLNILKFEECDCNYIITEIEPTYLDITGNDLIPQNFYPKPHNERQLDFILYPPHIAPKVTLLSDIKFNRNLLSNNTWQFRIRLKYKNEAYSVWSAWSKLISTGGECLNNYNAIDIDYSADIFNEYNDNTEFSLIDSVEIGYRNTNYGELNKFVSIPQCQIPKEKQVYRFYNDIHAEICPEIEDILQYDSVPLKSGALNVVGDTVLLGDNIEGYPDECLDFDVKVKYHKSKKSKTGGMRVKIRIWNSTQNGRYSKNQPIIKRGNSIMFGGFENKSGLNPGWEDIKKQDEFKQFLPSKGFVGYLVGTDYFGISKQIKINGNLTWVDGDSNIIKVDTENDWENLNSAIDGQEIYSILEINDIPEGTYIFRLASHLCSYNSEYGAFYDLNNLDLFKKTSTTVKGTLNFINSNSNADLNNEVYEQVVTINKGQITNLLDFVIEDCVNVPIEPNDNEGCAISGYVFDNKDKSGNKETVKELTKGISFENVDVKSEGDNEWMVIKTDHNGFYWGRDWTVPNRIPDNLLLSATIGGIPILQYNNYVYLGTLTDIYNGVENSKEADSISTGGVAGMVFANIPSYSIYATNNLRTHLKGKVLDQNGKPVAGLKYVVTGTNRVSFTDENGEYDIILYGDFDGVSYMNPLVRNGSILFYGKNDCLQGEFTIRGFNINPISINGYNNTEPFLLDDIIMNTGEVGQMYYLKNGGVYDFGVEELDRGNRKSTLYFNEKKHRIRLPFTTEKIRQYLPGLTEDTDGNPIGIDDQADGYFTAEIILKSKPSIWSTHLYVLRTEEQIYSDYIQFAVSDVQYVKMYDELNEKFDPILSNYNDGLCEIYLDLQTSFVEYKKNNNSSEKGWVFEKGDKIRFIYNQDGKLFEKLFEADIKAQRGNWFIIDAISGLPELKQGVIVEVFRIKQKRQEQIFYEISEYTKVLDRYLPTRSFRDTNITLNTGDAYRRSRTFKLKKFDWQTENVIESKVVIMEIEDPSPAENYIGKDSDIGRPSAINKYNSQLERPSSIRFGGKYIIGSHINELHSFIPTDIVEANNNYGRITIIEDFENVIFVAQETMCHIRYINKTRATMGDGENIVLDSNRFLSAPDYFSMNYGCTHPESYSRNENACYFVDMNTGSVLQYAVQNGVGNISGIDLRYSASRGQDSYMKKLLIEYSKVPLEVKRNIGFIFGGYHTQEINEVNISFQRTVLSKGNNFGFLNKTSRNSNIGKNDDKFKDFSLIKQQEDVIINANTICFDNRRNFWFGDREYVPEGYITLNNNAFAFKNGKLYILDKGNSYNEFFGVKYSSSLVVVMNQSPSEIKNFLAFSVESTDFWKNVKVRVPYNSYLGREQESITLDALIENKNGIYYGAIQKDSLTPNVVHPLYNGENMIGDVLEIEFENDSNDNVKLFAINVYAGYVGRTNF